MLRTIEDIWENLTVSSFQLQDVEGFPYSVYEEQRAKYEEAERWFRGNALEDQPGSPGEEVDLYPLRVNPILSQCLKHAHMLFGETQDDGRTQVVPKLIADSDEQKKLVEVGEAALNMVWWENNGRSLLLENGILSQIYGGSIVKLSYVPWEGREYGGWRNIPIRIERVNPKGFIGVPNGSDMYRLNECWIVQKIHRTEAIKWGYTGDEKVVWRVEHWQPDRYRVLIDGKVAVRRISDGQTYVLGGINPFRIVPVVYFPHVRAGEFIGINNFDHLKGLVREMNLRFGDYGDAVNDDAHSLVAYRNVQGQPLVKHITDGLPAIDLGSKTTLSGAESDPDMFEIRKQRASTAMDNLVTQIYKQYRRDSFIPAVADGEDEGSQRSGLTLAIRFWPLTSHVAMERTFFGGGLDVTQSYLLRMMALKNLGQITDAHTSMRIKHKWAPMLPRDREVDVQEWTQRAEAEIGSPWLLLELAGDVEDPDEEVIRMLDYYERKLMLEKKYAPQPTFGQPGSPGQNKPGGGSQK